MTKQTTQGLQESIDNYYEGKGCECFARSACDCACDVDWTPKEVYVLKAEILELRKEVERYKKLNADYIWFTRDEVKGLDENQTGIIDLAMRDLSQQLHSLERYKSGCALFRQEPTTRTLQLRIDGLKEKLESLKGQQ